MRAHSCKILYTVESGNPALLFTAFHLHRLRSECGALTGNSIAQAIQKLFSMSSLIYITRIQSPSAELAQALEGSGVHVKSFRPSEITADECVLVMTSEAVLAGLRRPGGESRSTPPLDAIQKHLGVDAAIWNRIKAGGVLESNAAESKAASEQSSVPAAAVAPDNLGFVASQAGARALLPGAGKRAPVSTKNAGVSGLPVSSMRKAIGRPGKSPGFSSQIRVPQQVRSGDGRHPKPFWQPVALVAVPSVFAVMLLAGRDSILPASGVAAIDGRNPGEQAVSGASAVGHRASTVRSSAKPSNPAAEARQHISDYDFVAEDYTTHFDQHSHPGTTIQAPDLGRGGPNRPVRKRVVID